MRLHKILFLLLAYIPMMGMAQNLEQLNKQQERKSTSSNPNGYISSHEYVDLGLPSGTLWATCNVGADSPSDFGNYYAWGETYTKSLYNEDNNKTRGMELGDDIGGNSAYDVVRANWGDSWRMPNIDEFSELIANCSWKWTRLKGHNGYLATGPNGKTIFFPAAGNHLGSSINGVGESGNYWSSTTNDDYNAKNFRIDFESRRTILTSRKYGFPVRGVSKRTQPRRSTSSTSHIVGHEYVDLGLPSGLKWATCNIGADSPSDYGNYYAWGEIYTKSQYTKDNSKTHDITMGEIGGNSSYDAARAIWGGTWRLPTKAECDELLNNCTWTWTKHNEHYGFVVRGPNGRTIFLPAAGFFSGSSRLYVGETCHYWSSTPYNDGTSAYRLCAHEESRNTGFNDRYDGKMIRPVSR